MAYYVADANGYIEDFASIGGLKQFAVWAAGVGGAVSAFARKGYTDDPDGLAKALAGAHAQGTVEEMRQALVTHAKAAKLCLILSDGMSDEIELRAAADPKAFQFDKASEHAKDWASEHAAELIEGISSTTRDHIQDAVEAAFEDQFTVDELADRINEALGDEARADVIARTETMRASNEGQREAWDQAVEDGLLTGDEKQEWIVTPDDRLCPICEPLDGEQVTLGEKFNVNGEDLDGPPAHPNCRCTLGIVG